MNKILKILSCGLAVLTSSMFGLNACANPPRSGNTAGEVPMQIESADYWMYEGFCVKDEGFCVKDDVYLRCDDKLCTRQSDGKLIPLSYTQIKSRIEKDSKLKKECYRLFCLGHIILPEEPKKNNEPLVESRKTNEYKPSLFKIGEKDAESLNLNLKNYDKEDSGHLGIIFSDLPENDSEALINRLLFSCGLDK